MTGALRKPKLHKWSGSSQFVQESLHSDPPCKEGNARFTMVPSKSLSDQYCGRHWRFYNFCKKNVTKKTGFEIINIDIYTLQYILLFLRSAYFWSTHRELTLDQRKLLRVPVIWTFPFAIFALRVAWNHAYLFLHFWNGWDYSTKLHLSYKPILIYPVYIESFCIPYQSLIKLWRKK